MQLNALGKQHVVLDAVRPAPKKPAPTIRKCVTNVLQRTVRPAIKKSRNPSSACTDHSPWGRWLTANGTFSTMTFK